MSSSENAKDVIEWVGLTVEVAQAAATLCIAIAGFVYSSRQKKAEEYKARRQLITQATSQIDMEYAMSVFKDRIFESSNISEGDYSQIFSERIKFPREPWQRLVSLYTFTFVCC